MTAEGFKLLPALLLLAVLGILILAGLATRTSKGEYYLGSARSVGRMGIGAAIASNWMSAASFLGIAGVFYLKGYFALAYVIGWTGGYVLLLILLAGQIRRFGKYTAPEFVDARYESPVARVLSAVIAILISLIYCVAQYKGIGLVFSWMFGLDYTPALFFGSAVVISYLVLSGTLGLSKNQQLQYALLILCFIVPLMAIARKLGYFWLIPQLGYGVALRDLTSVAGGSDYGAPFAFATPFQWIALCFTLMVGTAGLPHVLARFYTAPNIRDARWSVVWGLFFIGLLYWSAPAYGTFAKLREFQGGIPSDPAAARAVADLIVIKAGEWAGIPLWLTGVIAVGAIIAAFSTVSGLLVTGASAFSYDIYYRLINPRASERKRMAVAKGATLVLALLVVIGAINPPGLIAEITALAFALAGNTLFPVFLLGIWWDRTNKYGAVTGMVLGLCITFASLLFGGIFPWLHAVVPPTSSALVGAPLVIGVMIVVSLLTPPPPEKIRRFLAEEVHAP
ncbi:putative sodium:solute symporter [Desulfuromonas soudanensis]|uniref:Putative sodium:solute symporter n=1 Tax=Desulfuromonas soudanensis TaxID=1603606 RepID=A0A0M4DGI8_9BACT|nr:VC_2705 family sodium/solute symporter [Desulfuromonas soudanensis]ALC15745.1 putative sodium:solute symporter [Desulfuromonas soudanensis]